MFSNTKVILKILLVSVSPTFFENADARDLSLMTYIFIDEFPHSFIYSFIHPIISFAIVPKNKDSPIELFVGESRITEEVKKHLTPDCATNFAGYYVNETTAEGKRVKDEYCPRSSVQIKNYNEFYDRLGEIVTEKGQGAAKIWFSSFANNKIFQTIPEDRSIVDPPSPLRDLKAIKNPEENQGMKSAHVKDAVALIKFAAMLEKVSVRKFARNNVVVDVNIVV